jgi:tetratricopeptide (TPR) repeat protein
MARKMNSPARSGVASRRSATAVKLRAACVLSIAALLGLASSSSWAACKLKRMELPVKMVGERPIAMLGLNGTQVPMLVDTGAFFSMLTEAAASELKLHTRALPDGFRINGFAGALRARLTSVDKVQLPAGTIPDVEFIVGLNEVGGGAKGIIGRNLLGRTDVEIDLAHGMVRLFMPEGDCDSVNMAYWAGDTPVNVVPLVSPRRAGSTPEMIVAVSVNGKKMKALLDTGAPESTLMLSAAESAGIRKADMKPGQVLGGGGAGHVVSWLAPVDTFELGGELIRHNRLEVADTDWVDQDLILGVDYFLSHRIFIAHSQDKLYATWNGGAVFGRNTATEADKAVVAAAVESDAEVSSTDADGLARRGAASAARGDFARALTDFDRACALAPLEASHFADRARVELAMKRSPEALRDLDEALRLDPAKTAARMDRATLRAATGDHSGALDDLHTLDATLPVQSNVRAAMASTFAHEAMTGDALRQWDLWMAAHPHDGGRDGVLNQRCWLRVQQDLELDRALEDCLEAVDESPQQAAYRDSLGWVYVRRGDFAKAVKAFDEAIALRAASPWSFYGRGVARLRQGAVPAARADLAQARALEPLIDEQARRHGMAAE